MVPVVFIVVLLVLLVLGCGGPRSGEEEYIDLFDEIDTQIFLMPIQSIDPEVLENAIYGMQGDMDALILAFGQDHLISDWIEEATKIQCRDENIRASRNYLVLALRTEMQIRNGLALLGYEQMVSDTKLPELHVKGRIEELSSMGPCVNTAYEKAKEIVNQYKEENDIQP